MRIPEEKIQEIKDATDIVGLVGEYVPLKRSGQNYWGLCPFHSEKTPSFSVNPEKMIYKCFGCGEGGDAIGFVMKTRHLNYPEAIEFLAERAGIPLELRADPDAERKKRLYRVLRTVAKHYFLNLKASPTALSYLGGRNLSPEMVKRFGLGYAKDSWDDLLTAMTAKNVTTAELEELGLILKNRNGGYYDRFRNRLMFPIVDKRGRVIGFGGRTLGDDMAKYMNSPESIVFHKGNELYALGNVARSEGMVILVEGYMDTLRLYASGIQCAVASLGTSLTERQAARIAKLGVPIYVNYDGDTAGLKAALRSAEVFKTQGVEPKIVVLADGMDPDEYISAYGVDAYRDALRSGMPPVEFRLSRAREGLDFKTTEGRIRYIERAKKILASIDRTLIRDEYIRRVSLEMGIDAEALRRELRGEVTAAPAKPAPAKRTKARTTDFLEEDILYYAWRGHAEELEPIAATLSDEGEELFALIVRARAEDIPVEELIRIHGELAPLWDRIRTKEEEVNDKGLEEIFKRMELRTLRREREEIEKSIAELATLDTDEEDKKRLLKELLEKKRLMDKKLMR